MLTGDIFQKTSGEIFASHIYCKTTANEHNLLDTKHKQEPLLIKHKQEPLLIRDKAQLTETNGALAHYRTQDSYRSPSVTDLALPHSR